MPKLKIARQAFRRARQTELAAFADNIVARMSGDAAFQPLQTELQTLAPACSKYKEALAAARNRGISEVLAKNLAHADLVRRLNSMADALESFAGDNPQPIVDAGFSVQQSSGQRYAGRLPAPRILRAVSTGKKGEIRVIVDNVVPNAVRTHVIEYSLDRGNAWANGEYNSHRNFILGGLPHTPELWVHVKSVGHGANRSEWSEPVPVAVL